MLPGSSTPLTRAKLVGGSDPAELCSSCSSGCRSPPLRPAPTPPNLACTCRAPSHSLLAAIFYLLFEPSLTVELQAVLVVDDTAECTEEAAADLAAAELAAAAGQWLVGGLLLKCASSSSATADGRTYRVDVPFLAVQQDVEHPDPGEEEEDAAAAVRPGGQGRALLPRFRRLDGGGSHGGSDAVRPKAGGAASARAARQSAAAAGW